MDKQINHDKYHDESKTRTHRLSKLPDDGDPWAPSRIARTCQRNVLQLVMSRNFLDDSIVSSMRVI